MTNEVTTIKSQSVTERMAEKYGTDRTRFYNIVKATCKMEKATNEQFEAFLMTAEKYDLNPIMKQMWAYPDRNGGIMTMVSLDGWITIVNNQANYDGYETSIELDEKGYPTSATCTMWRKDRTRPTTKTVYLKEWIKDTSPVWKQMPRHFLEMRAYIQCARMCFNITGIEDGEVTPVIYSESDKFLEDKTTIEENRPATFDSIPEVVPTIIQDSEDFEIDPEIIKKAELLNIDNE